MGTEKKEIKTIGLVPNIYRKDILDALTPIVKKIDDCGYNYIINNSLLNVEGKLDNIIEHARFMTIEHLCNESDIVISIGGDGTMLTTAYAARNSDALVVGVNFGKLGFLAEFDTNGVDNLLKEIKEGTFEIEERMAIEAFSDIEKDNILYAVNDLVIDKGPWPKMIQLTVHVDGDYVSTFSADGLIVATPTGSTGYSLSAGGPIVNPKADAITLSPISPHSLNMRPLVLSSEQRINITVNSAHTTVQVNSDGQRVKNYKPPVSFEIYKSKNPVKLVHSESSSYFDILRKKLYWGIDVRNMNLNNPE